MVYVGYLVIIGTAVFLARTVPALRLDAVGESAEAAHAVGIDLIRVRAIAPAFGGAMAGLAGAYLSLTATGGVFVENMTLARGFLALSVAIIAPRRPFGVAFVAMLFGAAEALPFHGQVVLGAAVPPPLFLMLPFVLVLLGWGILGGSGVAPAEWGRPFAPDDG